MIFLGRILNLNTIFNILSGLSVGRIFILIDMQPDLSGNPFLPTFRFY